MYGARLRHTAPPDTSRTHARSVTCPEWVVDTVLDHVAKENKATGYDGVSVTLWKRVKTARRICKALVRLMWCYELPAEEVLLCLQVMIHKPGKGWGQRKCFRPITLCNDMYKCLDGCLFYYMARETGIIQEPPPEEETTREPWRASAAPAAHGTIFPYCPRPIDSR